jgi:NADH-ubiquinone oxidoreductase chain 2
MLVFYTVSLIICKSFNFNFSVESYSRITAIICVICGILTLNLFSFNTIESGLAIYGGLFHVTTISQLFEIFLFFLAALILTSWPTYNFNNNNYEINFDKIDTKTIISQINSSFVNNNSSNKEGLSLFTNLIDSVNKKFEMSNNILDIIKFNSYTTNYSLIIIFNLLGASLLISSYDLIALYLSIELQSFALYVLATLYRNSELATGAGLKYFLIGALASCFILLGSALIYSFTGLTNFESIFILISSTPLNDNLIGIILALLIVFVGLLIKIAAAPVHNWSPNVYDESPTIVTLWLNTIPKLSILILMLDLFSNLSLFNINFTWDFLIHPTDEIGFNHYNNLLILFNWYQNMKINYLIKNLLLITSLLSLFIGAIVGLAQIRFKRLLAYSSINHIGFILLALAINTQNSIDSFLFYILQYLITNLNIFLILLAISYFVKYFKIFNYDNSSLYIKDIRYIHELKGFFFQNPLLSLTLCLSLFSMAGFL